MTETVGHVDVVDVMLYIITINDGIGRAVSGSGLLNLRIYEILNRTKRMFIREVMHDRISSSKKKPAIV